MFCSKITFFFLFNWSIISGAVMDQSSDFCLLYPHYFINSFISLPFIEPQLPESFKSEELWTFISLLVDNFYFFSVRHSDLFTPLVSCNDQ